MNNPLEILPPLINVLVTGLFAGVVLRQYFKRQRNYQLYWSIALSMAFIATLAYILMLALGPTSASGILSFRLYYIVGGAVMPAWLGLGSIALVCSKQITRIATWTIALLSLLAALLIFLATPDLQKLVHIGGTPGTGILHPGPWLIAIILLNTMGVVAVAGIALYSGWKLWGRQQNLAGLRTSTILWANLCIFGGAVLNGTAGSLARVLGQENSFWLIMAAGWIVLFIGVLLANRRTRVALPSTMRVKSKETANI